MDESSSEAQRRAVVAARRRIARGERPRFHATWTISLDGSADVRVDELPLVHVYAEHGRIVDGARVLIARTLGVDPEAFDVEAEPRPPA